MNKSHTHFELIEAFLLNTLSESEREAFEKKLQADPDLCEQIKKHQQLIRVLEDTALIDIKNKLKHIHHQQTPKNLLNGRNLLFIAISIALILAVLFLPRLSHKQIQHPQNDSIQKPEFKETQSSIAESEKNSVDLFSGHSRSELPDEEESKEKKDVAQVDMSLKLSAKTDVVFTPTHNTQPEPTQTILKNEYVQNMESPLKDEIVDNDSKDPCRDIEIWAEVSVKESCSNKATGQITINPENITGGEPPYLASIAGNTFKKELAFSNLNPGVYPLSITDAIGCTRLLGNYTIKSIDCSFEYVFAPDKGEEWEIPKIETDGKIKIYTKAGNLVYEQLLYAGNSHTWQGINSSGYGLPMGVYIFIIEYISGENMQGTITLVR